MKKLNKNTIICITIIIIIIIFVIYYYFIKSDDYIETNSYVNELVSSEKNNQINNKIINITNEIVIHIAGAVNNEGIYKMTENSRIADCIEIAGGLTSDADISKINLAYMVEDGMKIYIPKIGEDNTQINNNTNVNIYKETSIESNFKNEESNSKVKKININTASQTELETLPGIGPSTALKIIEYRKQNGKFSSIEDIKKVTGIGDSKYNKINSLIKV